MRLDSLKSTFDEYKGWIVLVVVGYLLYSFRGLFAALGSTAGAGAEAVTAGLKASAEDAVKQQKVKRSGGTTKDVTAAQASQYEQDASTLANMLGHVSFGINTVLKDRAAAFAMLKRSYSRLNLWNNKPFTKAVLHGKTVLTNHTAETATCVKNATNWRVLAPFYKDVTSGRDLLADLRSDLDIPEYRPYIGWIL